MRCIQTRPWFVAGARTAVGVFALALAAIVFAPFLRMAAANENEAPKTYTVHITAGPGGAIQPSGNVAVKAGDQLRVTVTPSKGYAIAELKVDNKSWGPSNSHTLINVRADHFIQATFRELPKPKFTIVATAGPGGSISPAGRVGVVQGGSQVFNIVASAGHEIDKVTANGRDWGPTKSYTFTNVQKDDVIHATFRDLPKPKFTIVATAGPGGSISPAGRVAVIQGASQVFTITPSAGHKIDTVMANGRNWGPTTSYTFTNVQKDDAIHATFVDTTEPQFWTITATSTAGGLIIPKGSLKVKDGGSLSFEIIPSRGWTVHAVQIDQQPPVNVRNYAFNNVRANHTIYVIFRKGGGGGGGTP